ncbi:hypothetical protein F442_20371 [Phytophthora nicotianae P10297]|uniref:Uncharacterized protein n=6 Tax=Phytophthora nicotianae TaxID=4792 RepID=W2QWS4_PHYN3|nr:hypothetical protein PPTG_05874 [Phytophthora nicotianae INRA-310]ETI32685.1 hypothetical protein F443_20556 [Phytophthora nicotianae P1569]ETK73043.1 hypothetical protein L915_19975 [Phytophthora nicotianae]ETO61426.1 hypothetical protein F444_20564 [Phytophthora nicotianae P1976]ETP30681.1 hypothetical protein F442_20371 [Phytophthora nicotianae P10297]ETL26481.1 hypothetical protein L916_19859 [Phytophthora nicotianae]
MIVLTQLTIVDLGDDSAKLNDYSSDFAGALSYPTDDSIGMDDGQVYLADDDIKLAGASTNLADVGAHQGS